MMRIVMFLLVSFFAAQCSQTTPAEQKWSNDPVFADARICIDSCKLLLHDLQIKYDSIEKVNEFESLKVRNNHDMTLKNLLILQELLDSAEIHPDNIKDRSNYIIIVKSQCDYLKALSASGKAILGDHSQTFGKWQGKTPK